MPCSLCFAVVENYAGQLRTSPVKLLLLLGIFVNGIRLSAQDTTRNQSVSAGLLVPLGNFSATHSGGIGLQYAWHIKDKAKEKAFYFIANGGIGCYFGREEKVVTVSYTYPVFLLVHAYGGIVWQPVKTIAFALTGGPALGWYNSTARFNFGSKLEGYYRLSPKVSAGPSLQLAKEKGSDPLWAGSLSFQYHF